jgi:hypothetical protein
MGIAASAFAMTGLRPASAQNSISDMHTDPIADVRLGAYLPQNSRIKSQIGNTIPEGGVDYYLGHASAGARSIVSVDYIDRGSGDHKLQMIPVTFGQTNYQYANGTYSKVYYGYGVGAYFVNQDITDALGNRETNHTTLFGGYINIGTDLNQDFFLDARYHFTSSAGSANPGGLQLAVGVRF